MELPTKEQETLTHLSQYLPISHLIFAKTHEPQKTSNMHDSPFDEIKLGNLEEYTHLMCVGIRQIQNQMDQILQAL